MIHFVLLISRQGKVRLTKWYSPYNAKDKARAVREVSATVLARQQKQCNFLEYKDKKIIYKRYASLYFLACVDEEDNELIVLETIHHFVEVRAAASAAGAAAAAAAPSPTASEKNLAPTVTVSPSATKSSLMVPACGERASTVTLSVSTSATTPSAST